MRRIWRSKDRRRHAAREHFERRGPDWRRPTFPYPIYSKWFADYAAKTGVKINYQSIGSGGGIRQLTEGTVDFGASDAPMTDEELAKTKGPVLHVPTVLGAVVITYNVPGVTQPLKLSGDVIADLFLGKLTKWNDPRIKSLNPGVSLPATDVLIVHRSDGSGTTYIFSDYLAAVSPTWAKAPGRGKELQWPVGMGGKGMKVSPVRSSRLPERSAMSSWCTRSRTACPTQA